MGLWRKPYTLRRYEKRKLKKGYSTSGYTDLKVELDVQPLSTKELEALPEGQRSKRRVKAFGGTPIQTANQEHGTKADRLFYMGNWFECETSEPWDGSFLGHYLTQFVKVAESEQKPPPAPAESGEGK